MKSRYKTLLWWTVLTTMTLTLLTSCISKVQSTLSPLGPISTGESYPGVPPVTDTPDPSVSPLIISEVTRPREGTEVIVITNISGSEQNLEGMALLNPVTMEYVVFPNVTLLPGGSFKVYNGLKAEKIADGIKWLDEPVLRQPGDYIVLLNRAGRAIWYYVNP